MGRNKKGKKAHVSHFSSSESDGEVDEHQAEQNGLDDAVPKKQTPEASENEPPSVSVVKGPAEQTPIVVQYCPICTLPMEFCEFGGKFEECKTWRTNHGMEAPPSSSVESVKPTTAAKSSAGTSRNADVVLEVKKRNARKHITIVSGLQHYAVKLNDARALVSKRLGCGVHIETSEATGAEVLEFQGNVVETLPELLEKEFNIPETAFFTLEKGVKKRIPRPSPGTQV